MNGGAIAYVLGWMLLSLAVFMLIPASVAVALSEDLARDGFFVGAGVAAFTGGIFVSAFGGRFLVADRKHALTMLACAWLGLPLFAAIPFLTASTLSPSGALFEAFSAFTTTGATAFRRLADVARSLILWRALLQWSGGLLTLVSAIAILLPLYGGEAVTLRRSEGAGEAAGNRKRIGDALRIILPVYGGLTGVCLILLLFAQIPAFDALCLSLSTLSTGGFMPRDGTIALYGSVGAELVITVFMFFGAVSIFWTHGLIAGRRSSLAMGREPLYVAGAIILGGVLLTTVLWLRFPVMDSVWLQNLSLGLASAASIVTTSGFPISAEVFELVPFMVLVVVCAIGAGRLSTAGGLKLSRFAMMLSQSYNELYLLLFPHGIHPSVRGAGAFRQVTIATIWALFFLTMVALAVLIVLLAATGIPFEGAMLAAVTALSNAGPFYEIGRVAHLQAGVPPIWEMSPGAHGLLSVAMVLGRVELLAVVSLARLLLQRD